MLMISFVTKMVSMDMVVFSCPSLMKSLVVFERHSFSIELAGYIVKIRVPLPEFSYIVKIRVPLVKIRVPLPEFSYTASIRL